MKNAEIDKAILESCDLQWRKVAAIASRVDDRTGILNKWWGERLVTKRLRALVRHGHLHAAGNIYNWRASEIRLAPMV
ncbi:MAG: hypothetical protein ACX930_10945 [Erythrobacter sp.]